MSATENPEFKIGGRTPPRDGQKSFATGLRAKLALSCNEIFTPDDEWASMSAAVSGDRASRVMTPAQCSVHSTTPWTAADFAPSSQG